MYLIIALIMGVICAFVASSKGRNPIGWFFIGFLFGIFSLILILVISNKKEEKEKELGRDNEHRRLREQLRQERMKNEQFRKHAQGRLDTHDASLGIDTKNTPILLDQQSIDRLDDGGDYPETRIHDISMGIDQQSIDNLEDVNEYQEPPTPESEPPDQTEPPDPFHNPYDNH